MIKWTEINRGNASFLWPFSQLPLPLCFSDCKSVGLTWELLVCRTQKPPILVPQNTGNLAECN